MSGLCQYSDVFGKPREGPHRHRVSNFAIVDILVTGGAAFLVSRFALGRKDLLAHILVFIILILAGVLAHEAFCVNTRLNSIIFGRAWPAPHPRNKAAR